MTRTLRLAVAQSTVPEDPAEPRALRASGAGIRGLMREAAAGGARLVQFPEGAITYPSKHVMSVHGPERVARRTGVVPRGASCGRRPRRSPRWRGNWGSGPCSGRSTR